MKDLNNETCRFVAVVACFGAISIYFSCGNLNYGCIKKAKEEGSRAGSGRLEDCYL